MPGLGGSGVAGAVSADGKLLVYPTDTTIAGIEGNSAGAGRGIRIAMQYSNPTLSQDNTTTKNPDLNDEVSGNYNLVWLTSYVNPTGGVGTFATSTGSAVLNFDPTTSALTTSGDTISALTATGAAYNTLTVDLGTGAVSSGSGAETLLTGGAYQVLPGNGVIAPLGDTAGLLAGTANSGSGDFLQGTKLETSGGVSPLLVFSSKNPDGTMTGGGMGMGSSGCSDGGAGEGPGGMMTGGTSGEGRGLALAALQASGLTVADINGTYNVVAQMNGFTDLTTGSAQVDTEIRYGTLTFDGAGNVTSGSTFHKTASMNSADAIGGITTAVTTSTGTDTYTGTYTVSGTDATMTLTLASLATDSGFVSPDGSFMVFPVVEDGTGSGRRGLLLLVRQP